MAPGEAAAAAAPGWQAGRDPSGTALPAGVSPEALTSCANYLSAGQCEALMDLWRDTNGPGWKNNTGWWSDTDPGLWYGLKCADRKVLWIYLDGNGLNGTLPASLGNLPHLQWLRLGRNQLRGPIPATLGNLTNLTALSLHNNRLDGHIPSALGNLGALQELYLNDNVLSGPIPSSLGNLKQLKVLDLGGNQLSGPLPAQLGELTNLTTLSLWGNQLSGPIPDLGQLTKLEYLLLGRQTGATKLNGPIPSSLGNLKQLKELDLSYNQFTGEIPSELANLTNLERLVLAGNQLEGYLPVFGRPTA